MYDVALICCDQEMVLSIESVGDTIRGAYVCLCCGEETFSFPIGRNDEPMEFEDEEAPDA